MASKLVFYTYLKRILKKAKGILTITLFALAFLFGNGNGFPTRTGSHPLDYAPLSEPSIVSRRVDDLLDAFRRRNEVPEGVFSIGDDAVDASDFGNPAKYWQRGIDDDVVDVGRNEYPKNARDSNLAVDDDDVKFQALWAELSRQSAEIGELTAKVIHDDREIRQLNEKLLRDDGDIVELRVVVCRLLAALCHSQGSPCMECPWKDLPTEAPATTTEPATKTTTTITTSASPSTSTSETPTTPEARTTASDPPTTTAAPTTTTSTTSPTTTPTTTIVTYSTTTQPPSTTSASSSSSSTSSTDPATTTSAPTQTTSVEPSSSTVVSTTNAPSVTTTGANMTTTATTSEATTATTSEATTATTMITTVTTMSTTPKPTPDPKAKCDDPKPPENGYIVGNETTLGSHVEIKCKQGFTLVGVPMMECTALWSDETRSFSYNWAPPMSAVCKANAGYVSKGKGATKAKTEPGRKRRNVEKRAEVDNTKVRKRRSVETNEICNQPRVVGPCRAAFPRHFFNPESGMCEPFIFGGCMGNDNNFVTIEKCKMTCGS